MDFTVIWNMVAHDGAWAALAVFLIVNIIKQGKTMTDALVGNATALTALKTHIETVFKKPEDAQK